LQFNFSNYDFPFVWEVIPISEIMLKVGIVSPMALIGIVGNCLLLCTILGNRSLKSPTNYLISNMALSDLLLLLLSPGLFLTHEIFQSYKLGAVGCKLEGVVEIALLITSVITLCFVR
jgi:7 transmembrane receptor (rhodopsin family)